MSDTHAASVPYVADTIVCQQNAPPSTRHRGLSTWGFEKVLFLRFSYYNPDLAPPAAFNVILSDPFRLPALVAGRTLGAFCQLRILLMCPGMYAADASGLELWAQTAAAVLLLSCTWSRLNQLAFFRVSLSTRRYPHILSPQDSPGNCLASSRHRTCGSVTLFIAVCFRFAPWPPVSLLCRI